MIIEKLSAPPQDGGAPLIKIPTPWLEPFLAMMACENGAAKNTQQAYESDMMRWFSFVHQEKVERVQANHHALFIEFLEQIPLAARSIARVLSAVRHYFYFLSTEGVLPHDPWQGLRNPRYRAQLPQPLSVDAVACLLRYAHTDTSAEGLRLTALLELLYATGMRISELISLPTFHLSDDAAPSLRIRGKGGHERYVFFTPQARMAMNHYMLVRGSFLPPNLISSPYLFPSRGKSGYLTRQRVGQLLKGLAVGCKIDPDLVSPHGMRHAFATHLLQRGVDLITLKHLLGHQDIATTQIYTHVQTSRWADLLTQHHPLGHIG
jgi:integrase/recombinase XerD